MISNMKYGLTAQPELRAAMQYKDLERRMFRMYENYMDIKKTPWPTIEDKMETEALRDSLVLLMTSYYCSSLTKGSAYMNSFQIQELIGNLLDYSN